MYQEALILFVAWFCYVGLRAFQQKNVQHQVYLGVLPVSVLMAIGDVFMVSVVAQTGFHWMFVLAMGLGGGLGCMLSMFIYSKLLRRK